MNKPFNYVQNIQLCELKSLKVQKKQKFQPCRITYSESQNKIVLPTP